MTIKARLSKLEAKRQAEDVRREPSLSEFLADARTIDRWLDERGLTAIEAVARGETGPALRDCSLEDVAHAQWHLLLSDLESAHRGAEEQERRALDFTSPDYQHCAQYFRDSAARLRAEAAEQLAKVQEMEPLWRQAKALMLGRELQEADAETTAQAIDRYESQASEARQAGNVVRARACEFQADLWRIRELDFSAASDADKAAEKSRLMELAKHGRHPQSTAATA